MCDWIKFYDFKHSVIYVNARHRDVHYRTIAEDIRAYVPSPQRAGARLWLRRSNLRRSCRRRLRAAGAGRGRAQCARLADHALRRASRRLPSSPPNRRRRCRKASFDLIVMHSVAQYLTPAELDRLLAISARCSSRAASSCSATSCRRSLAAPAAALSLLRFGAANGFFLAAASGWCGFSRPTICA